MAASRTTSHKGRHPSRRAAGAASAVIAVATVTAGDLALVGVVGGVRRFTPDVVALEWCVAAAVITVATFALLGLPQIRLATVGGDDRPAGDTRTRWAVDQLRRGGPVAFAAASAVGGPLVIGWFAGRYTPERALRTTAAAAVVFGAFWAAVYLGVLTALF